MSRIIVKNLPKTITAKKLENIFADKGVITDLQLKFTKDGVFRQFAFVGYETEVEAQAARDYFNNTFIYTSKISVDICTNLSDPNKPKSWKKKISESKELKIKEKESKVDKQNFPQKKRTNDIPDEIINDPQFKEFLEVNKDRKSKPVWAEDIESTAVKNADTESDSSSHDSDYEENYKNVEKHLKSDISLSPSKSYSSETVTKEESKSLKKDLSASQSPVKKEKVFDDSFTVKLRNLPFQCRKKQIKQFFHPLKIASLRLPPKAKGFAYVKFKTERDFKQALIKNKGFLEGHRVDVVKYEKKLTTPSKSKDDQQEENSEEKNKELLAETGRIFVRNLCFTVTEKKLEELFNKYGPIAEIHLPVDFLTKKAQGFAFVSFVFAEHAVKAFTELDGTIFQGRVLHLIPAKPKKEYEIDENEKNFKKKKEAKMKKQSSSSHNWNILFLSKNAVADIVAEKYNVEKSTLLSSNSKESVAVRMALAETEMVLESRRFLLENGVQLDAFSQPAAERSKTVIVVKHLPAKTKADEIQEVFSKYGTMAKVIVPPSGMVALVEFNNPTEAKTAFKRLAYSRFRSLPLYLEWAPVDAIKEPPVQEPMLESNESPIKKDEEAENVSIVESSVNSEEPQPGTTVFVKNLNFETTEEDFRKHFEKLGPVYYATISRKTDIRTGKLLSMGFGFVQFKDKETAVKVVQNLQKSKLDGHALELKFAKRETNPQSLTSKKKYEVKEQTSAKIVVRNIPFQASEREIKELFKQFGHLKSVRLPKKLDSSGEHRGFGFVEYFSKNEAERAFEVLCHSTHLFDRRLQLEWAKTDADDVDELRKRTAKGFVNMTQKTLLKKRKLNEDVAIAASRCKDDED